MSFWEGPQGAARLKLAVLGRYLSVFSSKTSSTAIGRRVCYFDGYAGQGFYEDGSEGSPAIAAGAAEIFRNRPPQLDGFLVEADRSAFELLQAGAGVGGYDEWEMHHGVAEDFVERMLEWAGPSPLLAFIDPFALGVPYTQVLEIMARTPATEVLLNVSKHGIRRFSGHLTGKPHAARQTFIDKLDAALGGDWWQEIVVDQEANDETAQVIASEFCERLRRDTGSGSFVADVRDRLDGPIDYYLLLLSKHRDGLWHFNEAVSKSIEEERQYQADSGGTLYFDESPAYVARIRASLEANMKELAGQQLRSKPSLVFGDTAGLAREMHVRKALEALHKAGSIETDPKGETHLSRFVMRPT